ncbi:DUF86 domain-containing protein [bacterium]|nr:DUF86 domain-containing protein [bacterium]
MREERTYLDYLEDIQDAIEKVALFIVGMNEAQFIQDDKTVFAVIRAFEILGEAAKQIPADIRLQYPDLPWKEMAQMRDVLIHHYFGVNRSVVWKTAIEQLPPLLPQIQQIINEIEK